MPENGHDGCYAGWRYFNTNQENTGLIVSFDTIYCKLRGELLLSKIQAVHKELRKMMQKEKYTAELHRQEVERHKENIENLRAVITTLLKQIRTLEKANDTLVQTHQSLIAAQFQNMHNNNNNNSIHSTNMGFIHSQPQAQQTPQTHLLNPQINGFNQQTISHSQPNLITTQDISALNTNATTTTNLITPHTFITPGFTPHNSIQPSFFTAAAAAAAAAAQQQQLLQQQQQQQQQQQLKQGQQRGIQGNGNHFLNSQNPEDIENKNDSNEISHNNMKNNNHNIQMNIEYADDREQSVDTTKSESYAITINKQMLKNKNKDSNPRRASLATVQKMDRKKEAMAANNNNNNNKNSKKNNNLQKPQTDNFYPRKGTGAIGVLSPVTESPRMDVGMQEANLAINHRPIER